MMSHLTGTTEIEHSALRSDPNTLPGRSQNDDCRATILMISKPVAPPWNDSSKNLVKDLATHGQRFGYHVLTPAGSALIAPNIVNEGIYDGAGHYTPPLIQNIKVVRRLIRRDGTSLAHFFFAPNVKSALAARLALRLRRRKTIQTVCSIPRSFNHVKSMLFADKIIVLSKHTHRALLEAGIARDRIEHIYPGIVMPPRPAESGRRTTRNALGIADDAFVVIYPGDYLFSRAADTVARSVAKVRNADVHLIFACRVKQEASKLEEARIEADLRRAGLRSRVTMLGQVDDMIALLAATDLVVLPAESLYAKMDIPLVLLEAMALSVPIVVADRPPLTEMIECASQPGGLAIPPQDPTALAKVIDELADNAERCAAFGRAAQSTVCDQFEITAIAQQHEALYQRMIEGV